jgi:uncharacterized protein (DUF4415 family)
MARARIVRLSEEEMRAARARMREGVEKASLNPEPAAAEMERSVVPAVHPTGKQAISLRVDEDVLAFFRSEGRGYQTRMNAVLRSYMMARRRRGAEQ